MEIYNGPLKTIDADIASFGLFTVNLSDVLEENKQSLSELSVNELKDICASSKIIATIYPNGNGHLIKFNSEKDAVRTCYLIPRNELNMRRYFLIAMDEQQPMIYKVQLLGVYEKSSAK